MSNVKYLYKEMKNKEGHHWLNLSSAVNFINVYANFGTKAETYLEKAAKKDVRTKNLYIKR